MCSPDNNDFDPFCTLCHLVSHHRPVPPTLLCISLQQRLLARMSSLYVGLGVRTLGRSTVSAGAAHGGLRSLISATRPSTPAFRSFTTKSSLESRICVSSRWSVVSSRISSQCTSTRYNSSSPNSAAPASPAIISSESKQPADTDKRSTFAKFRASLSLADQGNVTSEESATSGVKKLLNLARPESRQLSMAVGLVSLEPASVMRFPWL